MKKRDEAFKFMHVCGTHQDTLIKHGLNIMLKEADIEIGQGPGCPVCVTTPREIEEILLLAKKGKTVATFGDMVNVPGESQSLRSVRTEGCDVRTVYSIEDAVALAERRKTQEVVFMAVGFETTAPSTASIVLRTPPKNFSILNCHRIIPPALKTILEMGEIKIDGLIEPGHVSTIIGLKPYEFISKEYGIPQVVAGFEPLDLLMGIWMLVEQIRQNTATVQNEYSRVVHIEGNRKAKKIMDEAFEPTDKKWRGFPIIPQSGLELRREFDTYDARKKFEDELEELREKKFTEPKDCRCGELLRGLLSPHECPLFGTKCTPAHPVGPCMVSIEGSCNIEFRYSKKH